MEVGQQILNRKNINFVMYCLRTWKLALKDCRRCMGTREFRITFRYILGANYAIKIGRNAILMEKYTMLNEWNAWYFLSCQKILEAFRKEGVRVMAETTAILAWDLQLGHKEIFRQQMFSFFNFLYDRKNSNVLKTYRSENANKLNHLLIFVLWVFVLLGNSDHSTHIVEGGMQ